MSEYINQGIINEFTNEAAQTRKLLALVPFDKNDYKPHEKSMKLGSLAGHIAELAGWLSLVITTNELDFSKGDYKRYQPQDSADLLRHFDDNVQKAIDTLQKTEREEMLKPWTMRMGEQVFFSMPKVAVVRSFAINHMIHHRGQLSVYLRLNDIAIPGMYGPSADGMS
jgi:uncharacterized damage-inducible protein DinB